MTYLQDDLAAPASIKPDRRRHLLVFLLTTKRMRPVKTYLVFLGSCAMTMKPLNIM